MATEARNPRSERLGAMSAPEVVRLMNAEERVVLDALDAAADDLATAASVIADVHRRGGRVFLLGAGTSGRLAVMEAAELPATFGVAPDRFVAFIASGPSGGPAAVTRDEDDVEAASRALRSSGCGPGDAVIGLAASGTTPFVLAGVRHGRSVGAWVCGIANNPSTPLLSEPDLGILLDTGAEVVTGSTRLKAGTAQKLALNRLTTAAMVINGKVVGNLMAEVRPANEKLRARCIRIVMDGSGLGEGDATTLLEATAWDVRTALAVPPGRAQPIVPLPDLVPGASPAGLVDAIERWVTSPPMQVILGTPGGHTPASSPQNGGGTVLRLRRAATRRLPDRVRHTARRRVERRRVAACARRLTAALDALADERRPVAPADEVEAATRALGLDARRPRFDRYDHVLVLCDYDTTELFGAGLALGTITTLAPPDDPERWDELPIIRAGDRVLLVTNTLEVPTRHCDAVRGLGLVRGAQVDTIGVDLNPSPAQYLRGLRSAIVSMQELLAAIAERP
jgi:N-acetylmuramic acid 6-phosphate etherase